MIRPFVRAAVVAAALTAVACAPRAGVRHGLTPSIAPREDRDPAVLLEAGRAYADEGDLVRAEQYLAAAIAHGADERVVVPLLLRVCIASRHYRLGVEYAEVALARNPESSRLRFLTGALYVATGDTARARPHLERAARERSGDAELQFEVGVVFRDEMSDVVNADLYFREYLRLAPAGEHAQEARSSLMERIE